MYLITEENTLKLMASHAYHRRKSMMNEIKLGDGILGQVALEKEMMILESLPEGYLPVSSGLGEASANQLLIFPILLEGKIEAIIELGTLGEFKKVHLDLLKAINDTIAFDIESSRNRETMACLLTDSQKKSQALERQSEELAANNQALAEQTEKVLASEEELKAQSEELKAQSEELKAQGEELLIKNNELEEKTRALELQKHDIEEKNSALEESKTLLQTKADELEKSSKYKTEFLSNMSHELRTPLNSLLILSQSFMDNDDGNLTQDQIERASVIYNSGRDLLTLINDILDLSKVEAGKLVIEFNEYEPAKVAKSVCGLLKPVSDKKGIDLIIDIDRDIKQFMISDRIRIEQILKNLMSNAVKFSEEGSEILLKVYKIANSEHSSTKIAFAVQDSHGNRANIYSD